MSFSRAMISTLHTSKFLTRSGYNELFIEFLRWSEFSHYKNLMKKKLKWGLEKFIPISHVIILKLEESSIFCGLYFLWIGSFSSNVEILAITKKMAISLELPRVFQFCEFCAPWHSLTMLRCLPNLDWTGRCRDTGCCAPF